MVLYKKKLPWVRDGCWYFLSVAGLEYSWGLKKFDSIGGGVFFNDFLSLRESAVGGWVFHQIDSMSCGTKDSCISARWVKKCLDTHPYNFLEQPSWYIDSQIITSISAYNLKKLIEKINYIFIYK